VHVEDDKEDKEDEDDSDSELDLERTIKANWSAKAAATAAAVTESRLLPPLLASAV
jgi:hypothetical protein